jgi:hypothetical protein
LLTGRPLYRYQLADVTESGWQEIKLRWDIQSLTPYRGDLSKDACGMLDWLRAWGETNRVRIAYSLPWGYVSTENAMNFHEHSRNFLLQVAAHIPVLKDPKLGAHCVRRDFSDTSLHLTQHAAALRMDSLCHQITNWSVWTSAELTQLPLTPDSSPQGSPTTGINLKNTGSE